MLAEIPPRFVDFLKSDSGHLQTCAYRNLPHFADFFKSASGHLLTCACRNPPQVCRFSQISHWTFTDMHLQKFPPRSADFLKSATGHLLTCACRNSPKLPQPLDNCRFLSNQPVDIYWHVLAEIPPRFADFLKSATGHLLTCAYRNSSRFADFLKSATHCRFTKICFQKSPPPDLQIISNQPVDIYWHVLAEIPPRFADFLKSATGHLLTCACRNSPNLQIFSNQPVDIYWHVLAEIPLRFADFLKSATGHLLTCPYRNSPEVCRFSQISQ